MGPNDKFDLVIKGGEVLDPSQNLKAKRDIGIRFGVIEALEADIPADKARACCRLRQARDAGSDRPARPRVPVRLGHRHSGRRAGPVPGHHDARVGGRCRRQQHRSLSPRHRRPDARAPLCVRAHRQHGLCRFPVPELYNIDFAQTEAAAKAVAENADLVLGVKVRMSENVIAKHGRSRSSAPSRPAKWPVRAPRSCVTSAGSRRPS